jgi:hypothetical protein
MATEAPTETRYLRKSGVRKRYDNISARAVDYMVADGRLPCPTYIFGDRHPFWDVAELDENDRRLKAEAQTKGRPVGRPAKPKSA